MNSKCQQLEFTHNLNDLQILKPYHASKFLKIKISQWLGQDVGKLVSCIYTCLTSTLPIKGFSWMK
jgi:hypothetical protein